MHDRSIPDVAGGPALIEALSESRARWRHIAMLGYDMVFETDAEGRFAFAGPEQAFGWQTAALLGLPTTELLVQVAGATGLDPLRPPSAVRRHHATIRHADGRTLSVLVSAGPLLDPDGQRIGSRGAIQDITVKDQREATLADILLRRQTIEEIARRMRRAVLPDMVIKIGLEELCDATGSGGAVIVGCDASPGSMPATDPFHAAPPAAAFGGPSGGQFGGASGPPSGPPSTAGNMDAPARWLRVLHRGGGAPPALDAALIAHVGRSEPHTAIPWTVTGTGFDCRLLMSATGTHFSEPVVLLMWREASRDWVPGDAELAQSFMSLLSSMLEHDEVQRELARRSGADTLTGLLNRESFVTEVTRRLDRLDREGLAATLMVVGLDRFRELNDQHGPESGDELLRQAAQTLRLTVRPTDLVARLGSDLFALWLDGADQFTAAERAETLCQHGIAVTADPPVQLKVSVGLSTRPCRSFETIEGLLEQAHAALGAIKLAGGGRWHFYNEGGA